MKRLAFHMAAALTTLTLELVGAYLVRRERERLGDPMLDPMLN
jgi:hypothetical protein